MRGIKESDVGLVETSSNLSDSSGGEGAFTAGSQPRFL